MSLLLCDDIPHARSKLSLNLQLQRLSLGLRLSLWCLRGRRRAIATLLRHVVSGVILCCLALAATRGGCGFGRSSVVERGADSLNLGEDCGEVGLLLDLREGLAGKVVSARYEALNRLVCVPYALSGVSLVVSAHSSGNEIPVL